MSGGDCKESSGMISFCGEMVVGGSAVSGMVLSAGMGWASVCGARHCPPVWGEFGVSASAFSGCVLSAGMSWASICRNIKPVVLS